MGQYLLAIPSHGDAFLHGRRNPAQDVLLGRCPHAERDSNESPSALRDQFGGPVCAQHLRHSQRESHHRRQRTSRSQPFATTDPRIASLGGQKGSTRTAAVREGHVPHYGQGRSRRQSTTCNKRGCFARTRTTVPSPSRQSHNDAIGRRTKIKARCQQPFCQKANHRRDRQANQAKWRSVLETSGTEERFRNEKAKQEGR
mmetsp:Transcript_22445/g.63589  ORF Transcript_22445/g.63589 Transcript_22445/m.63589 type:complete len:200 (+) Transcript_22445:1471-2070(+)